MRKKIKWILKACLLESFCGFEPLLTQWRIYKYPRGRSRVARELSQKSNDDDLALVLAKEIEGVDHHVCDVFVISGLVGVVLAERNDHLSDLKKLKSKER